MKKVAIIAISLAALLTGCASSGSEIKQMKTHDGYLVECVYAGSGNGVSCDWEHQEKQ